MSEKVTGRHLRRKAILYVRQSTLQQLQHNEESRRLQYAMRERLLQLGWKEVELIDEDLGRSASGVVERPGFQRLVAAVSLGEVGAVGARELSRFARNSRDWQQLIEVCRYVDTLLVDQDAIYDARSSNDRLLLGLKGSLNEYELDLLRLRAQEARREKARRGEFIAKVAVGYRKSEDGTLEKTPDRRVQRAIELAFSKCLELGSVRQTLLWLRTHDLEVPINRNHRGEVLWNKPSYTWLHRLVTNPVYAGAYAYGRTVVQTVWLQGEARLKLQRRPREQWAVLLRDHHEAYIEWERFERIQQMIASNSQVRRSSTPGAAKKGAALISGLLRCRRCGQKLNVSYSGRGGTVRRYCCERRHVSWGEAPCISFSAVEVDERVAQAVLQVVRPAAVEASLRAATEEAQAQDEVIEALHLELKAAQYGAERAFRQFDAVDPHNRLVADELERRWNEALARTRTIEDRIREHHERRGATGPAPHAATFAELGADLARVWNTPSTDMRLKKRIVRTLVEEVIADVDERASEIVLVVHWKGGVHTELRIPKRRRGYNGTAVSADVVEAVRLLARVCPDDEIARALNKAGLLTAKGHRWTRALVASLRNGRAIPAYSREQCETDGWLTLEKAAALAGVASITLKRAVGRGVLAGQQPLPGGPWLFRRDELLSPDVRERLLQKRRPRPREGAVPAGMQLTLVNPRR